MSSGTFPSVLKTGIVSPVYKKGGSRAMLLGGCQNCWGGASSTARSAVEQVRPRQREALAEGAAAGVWGRKNRSPRVLECT